MGSIAGRRLGRYELGALIGAGGMGEVFRARDTRLGREVAIKVLPAGVAADHCAEHVYQRIPQTRPPPFDARFLRRRERPQYDA